MTWPFAFPPAYADKLYHTSEELVFCTEFARKNRPAFELYAAIVLEGRRRFDDSVDVAKVRSHVRGLLEAT